MKLFSLFKSQHYKPVWVYKVDGQLWRVLFSHGDLVAGEHRDNDKKSVTFFCIDSRTGKEKWTHNRGGEEWWTTIEGVYGRYLYLHAFAKPDLPNPRHVTSIDMETGSILWDHPELTFLYVKDDSVVVEQSGMLSTKCHRLDPASGEILDTIEDRNTIENERLEARANDPHVQLTFPEMYNPEFNDHGLFARIVGNLQRKERLVDPVEVLKYGNNLIVCFHKVKSGGANGNALLTHELIIFNKNDFNELYSDVLFDDASAPVPDGFFLRGNTLYYIREKSELVAVNLQESE